MNISAANLRACYVHSKNHLLPLLQDLRSPGYRIKLQDVNTLFTRTTLWTELATGSGHKKFIHDITGIVIEYQGHIKGKDNNIAHSIQSQLLDQLQKHVNIFNDIIFHYCVHNWKEEPNYHDALHNCAEWMRNRHIRA